MKFTVALIAAAAALVSAQADIPACAVPCLNDAVTKSTSCKTTDYSCICAKANFDTVQAAATSCILQKCGSDVALNKVLPAVTAICKAQGSAPASSSVVATSKTTEAAMTSAASTYMPPSAMSTKTSSMSAMSSMSSMMSSHSSMMSSMMSSAMATSTGKGAAPTYAVPTGNGTSTPPKTSSPPTAGAAGLSSVGVVAIAAIAALAL